jgi:hypothetical protein
MMNCIQQLNYIQLRVPLIHATVITGSYVNSEVITFILEFTSSSNTSITNYLSTSVLIGTQILRNL